MRKYSSTAKGNFRHSKFKLWYQGAVITAAILVFGWFFPTLISGAAYVITIPLSQISQWYRTSEEMLPKYLRNRTALIEENETLRQQIVNQSGTQSSIARLLFENMQLRVLLNNSTTSQRIMAKVVTQPTTLNYDLLQIDQGSSSGVEVGAPVFVGLDSVIGVVVHTTPTYAFVDLITSSGFTADVYLVGPNIFAALEGMGGGVARVKVPQGVPIAVGNLVLLPAAGSGIYGEIVSVENAPTQPEQYGYVTPTTPLKGLLYLSVAKGVPPVRNQIDIDDTIRLKVRDYFRHQPLTTINWTNETSGNIDTPTTTVETMNNQ